VSFSGVVVCVTTATVLPVAAHRGLGTGQPTVVEEVAADALHRRGSPATHTWVPGTRSAPRMVATSTWPGDAPGGRSHHSTVAT
jgi:hypothetical protein